MACLAFHCPFSPPFTFSFILCMSAAWRHSFVHLMKWVVTYKSIGHGKLFSLSGARILFRFFLLSMQPSTASFKAWQFLVFFLPAGTCCYKVSEGTSVTTVVCKREGVSSMPVFLACSQLGLLPNESTRTGDLEVMQWVSKSVSKWLGSDWLGQVIWDGLSHYQSDILLHLKSL